MKFSRKSAVCLVLLLLSACARNPLRKREDALRLTGTPALADDLDLLPLAAAVRKQAAILRVDPHGKIVFGKRVFRRDEYAFGLETFAALAEKAKDKEAFLSAVKERFDFYEVYGGDAWGKVYITSYFEPLIQGSTTRTEKYTTPILRTPGDLVVVSTGRFDDRFSELPPMRGRLVAAGFPPGQLQLVPYYSRADIDGTGALSKRGLEIAWADPIDVFFMQIQGSGTIVLENGKHLRVGFADQNGYRYESIGKFMRDVLPKDNITMQTIEAYLRTLPWDKAKSYLFRNPSYVFFQERDGEPTTRFGTPAVAGRTIATDPRYFPKGTLAFLSFDKPRFDNPAASEPAGFDPTCRFVVDDDVGGAIRGGGRVDLFWGSGAEASRSAGVVKSQGKLFYLAPKAELLKLMGTTR